MRIRIVASAAAAGLMLAGALTSARAADSPYYRLNYANYDTTYEAVDAKARTLPSFYWDGKRYCRYRTAWNGPGAYEIGTRDRPGLGWDGGYPWQGPGTPEDHDDAADYAESQAAYAAVFGREPVCEPHVHYRRHRSAVVLRRKD